MVAVDPSNGRKTFARTLIDSGSEVTCFAKSLVQRRTQLSIPINSVGEQQFYETGCTNFNLCSRTDKRYVYSIDAYILKKLSSCVPRVEDKSFNWLHIKDLELADPQYESNTTVELILGADIYAVIVQEGTIPGSVYNPVVQRTTLGWSLTCASSVFGISGVRNIYCTTIHQEDEPLSNTFTKFCELKSVSTPTAALTMSKEHAECERHFRNTCTYSRDACGKFTVRLPFKSNKHEFPNSLQISKQSFYRLEKRLCNNKSLYEKYNKFLSKYQELNHMKFLG